jgi:pSer/pThr/pTyr-binding forkhead associated (FHA) protein
MRNDSLDIRWFNGGSDIRYDPKLAQKKSITLKFHDGLLTGTKVTFESQDKLTLGQSPDCDIVLPVTSGKSITTNLSQVHAQLIYDRGYWYLEDQSGPSGGTYIYPRNVLQMKNHEESGKIKVPNYQRLPKATN